MSVRILFLLLPKKAFAARFLLIHQGSWMMIALVDIVATIILTSIAEFYFGSVSWVGSKNLVSNLR